LKKQRLNGILPGSRPGKLQIKDMTNIITYADFTGVIALDTYKADVQEVLTHYITKYQEKILRSLLGDTLYFDMEDNTTAAKYVSLRDGDTVHFEYGGYNRKYTGLKAMIANFVYYYYSSIEISSNTPMGETQSTGTNGASIQNLCKLYNAYNEGVKLYKEAIMYILYKNSVDPTLYADFCYTELNEINSFGI